MVWRFIIVTGPGELHFVKGNINAEKYICLMKDALVPFMDSIPLAERFKVVFQQDNAAPHRARTTMEFFQREHIVVPPWPALSPDINQIENVWVVMKRAVRKDQSATLNQLRSSILHAWNETVTPTFCARLYGSMQSRIQNVISHNGLRL